MKTKTYYHFGILLFLFLGFSQKTDAQLVTKHGEIEPQYSRGYPFSKLIWLDEYKPLSYSEQMVTKFAINGSSIIYNKSYEINGYEVNGYTDVQEIGGKTIFASSEYLFATNGSGTPLWAVYPEHHIYASTIQSYCASNGGEIITFSTEEKYSKTYLTICEIESASGNLISYTEFQLDIPTDIHRSSLITTATRIPGEGYFLTLSSSMNEAFTISLDFGLDITGFFKQEYIKNGNPEPLDVHEILLTNDREMFFIQSLNDGSSSTPRGVLIGKLNFSHDFITVKYIEPSGGSNYFNSIYQQRSLIVETEKSISVNLDVDGDGTVSTLLDGVTFGLTYYDGNKHLATLIQYDVDFTILSQAVAYDYGAYNENATNINIIKDYQDRIQMKVGVFDNPSYTPGVIDTSYYNLVPHDNFYNNCHAISFEMAEVDLEHVRHEAQFNYSTDEFELREADITDTDLEFTSKEECNSSQRPRTVTTTVTKQDYIVGVAVYPNPSTGDIFVNILEMDNSTVAVYAVTGELIKAKQIVTNNKIEIKNLPKGVYFVNITDELGNSKNERVIIK